MGGPNGVGLGNQPQIMTFPGLGNVGNVSNVPPSSTQPNIAPQQERAPQTTAKMPTRAADVVGQLDVLLMKALNGASGEINAEDVAKAAAKAKLPKEIRESLRSLAETAQGCLAALDKFTGKDLAAAMEKKADNSIDWKDDSLVAKAFKDAQIAQQELSNAIADVLGQIKNGKAQATLEELMLQCDRRVAEIDTLALQMADIIDKGGEDAQANAAALANGGTISSFRSENALDKFGRNEMFNALTSDLKPLTNRLDQYANDGVKDLKKDDVKACVRELNAIKAKFSAAAASGTLTIGTKTVLVDRSLLGEASKLLDGVGKKINAIHRDLLQEAMVKLVEKEIPFFNDKLFTDFADEIGTIETGNPKIKPQAMKDYVKLINTFRSAARTYAKSPTGANANKLRDAALNLTYADTDGVTKCFASSAIVKFRAPANASQEFKDAVEDFRIHALKTTGQNDNTAFSDLIRSYDHIDIAADRLIALGKEMNAGPDSKYFISGAVLDVFKGETSLSPLIESRVHGYSDSDINIALDDKNVTGAKTLGSGNFNTVTLVTVKDGSEWVFKPELAGRLTAPNSPLNIGMNVNQEITRINLAVQTTANALGLDDIMVKTSVGTHQGQFGMFMEKAPGVTGKEFKKSGKSELTQMNDADFGKVVGGMMRKLNRLQWFDIITGQGDRHADNYMIDVKKGVPPSVDIKAIDNDASFGIFRQGLNKFFMRGGSSMEQLFRNQLEKVAKGIANEEEKDDFIDSVFNDPGVKQGKDGSITIDLTKATNAFLLKSLIKDCGVKNIAPPAEIDKELYDKLMTLAKDAPDGGVARKNYLTSIAQRLGKNSAQYKAAVLRLDESIAYAKTLNAQGKVYTQKQWMNHDVQRNIAKPNLDNRKATLNSYGATLSGMTKANATHNAKYAGYSNTFFRDFYDTLILNSTRKNWFE